MNIKAHHQSNVPEPAPTAPTPIPGEVVPVAEAEEARGFDWNGYLIRVIMNHSEPWFVLSDLSKALGLSRKPAATAERLDPDGVRQTYTIDSLGRKRQVTVIDESAMYQLVIRSDKPEAKEFQRWITREVLPQIRRTGMYLPTTSADPYSVMRAMLDQLESVDRKAAEAKEIAVRAGERTDLVEARVDLIMGGHGPRLRQGSQPRHVRGPVVEVGERRRPPRPRRRDQARAGPKREVRRRQLDARGVLDGGGETDRPRGPARRASGLSRPSAAVLADHQACPAFLTPASAGGSAARRGRRCWSQARWPGARGLWPWG